MSDKELCGCGSPPPEGVCPAYLVLSTQAGDSYPGDDLYKKYLYHYITAAMGYKSQFSPCNGIGTILEGLAESTRQAGTLKKIEFVVETVKLILFNADSDPDLFKHLKPHREVLLGFINKYTSEG